MSQTPPPTPHKRNQSRDPVKSTTEANNNKSNRLTERQQARTFVTWYKHLVDNERQNLALYLADDATLEWFGRTIKTRKKVSTFLKYDMQCSQHDFTTVDSIDKIQTRREKLPRKGTSILASPLHSPETVNMRSERSVKRKLLRSNCSSPEWADGCGPNEIQCSVSKRLKMDHEDNCDLGNKEDLHALKRRFPEEVKISHKGDGMIDRRTKRKCVLVTPPNPEVGQGDCLPSTSGTDSDKSHEALNAQLTKFSVECNGYVEFTRTRNSRSSDTMKWERKCKLQISYSEDPLNIGEYIIWALLYTDESKCRRNLLAAFEEVAKEEENKKC